MNKDGDGARRRAIEALIQLESRSVRGLSDEELASKEAGLIADIRQLAMDIQVRWVSPEEAAKDSFELLCQLGKTAWEKERRGRRRYA